MGRYRIVVLPGDGIGPEVMEVSPRVLRHAAEGSMGLALEFTEHAAGVEHCRRTGEALPRAVLDDFLRADAVFPAAIGLPEVRRPDGTEVQTEMMNGTAPQLAGRNTANPMATILSGGLMLDWLGERHGDPGPVEAGRRVEEAVARVLAEGATPTADLGGRAGTPTVGDAVIRALAAGWGSNRV